MIIFNSSGFSGLINVASVPVAFSRLIHIHAGHRLSQVFLSWRPVGLNQYLWTWPRLSVLRLDTNQFAYLAFTTCNINFGNKILVLSSCSLLGCKAFIACVLLVLWSSDVSPKYSLVELFSGLGQVGKVWRLELDSRFPNLECIISCTCHICHVVPCSFKCAARENGYNVGQYDWDYAERGMNFLSNGGFACVTQICNTTRPNANLFALTGQTWTGLVIDVSRVPRTAIYLVACLAPLGLLLLGPDCSSWTLVSRGSSWRSVMNPNGRLGSDWIRNSNLMISRWFGWILLDQYDCGWWSKCRLDNAWGISTSTLNLGALWYSIYVWQFVPSTWWNNHVGVKRCFHVTKGLKHSAIWFLLQHDCTTKSITYHWYGNGFATLMGIGQNMSPVVSYTNYYRSIYNNLSICGVHNFDLYPYSYMFLFFLESWMSKVFKKRFWMMHHGGCTPKPTVVWGNEEDILSSLEASLTRIRSAIAT